MIISMPGDTVSINEPTNSRKHIHFVFYDARRRAIRNNDFSAIQMLWAERRSNLIPKTVIYLMNYSNELSELLIERPSERASQYLSNCSFIEMYSNVVQPSSGSKPYTES